MRKGIHLGAEGDAAERKGPHSALILSDGKAGDELPCIGVAEHLGIQPRIRRILPVSWGILGEIRCWLLRRSDPWEELLAATEEVAPSGKEAPLPEEEDLFPDLVIASGRRAVPFLHRLTEFPGRPPSLMTVFLKDPRIGSRAADLIWVPEHDTLRGLNVFTTLTSPHACTSARLAAAHAHPFPILTALPAPRVAVLVGGSSRHYAFSKQEQEEFCRALSRLQEEKQASLMITVSRRTPAALLTQLRRLLRPERDFLWEGPKSGPNPYLQFLVLADAVIVTSDSVNMVGEAAVTGRPVLIFYLRGGHRKISYFLRRMEEEGITRPFRGAYESYTYAPIDATEGIAKLIKHAYRRYKQTPCCVEGRNC